MIRGWTGEKEPVWAELNGWLGLDGRTSGEACTDHEKYLFFPVWRPSWCFPMRRSLLVIIPDTTVRQNLIQWMAHVTHDTVKHSV
jgi:hypothetical protein